MNQQWILRKYNALDNWDDVPILSLQWTSQKIFKKNEEK